MHPLLSGAQLKKLNKKLQGMTPARCLSGRVWLSWRWQVRNVPATVVCLPLFRVGMTGEDRGHIRSDSHT